MIFLPQDCKRLKQRRELAEPTKFMYKIRVHIYSHTTPLYTPFVQSRSDECTEKISNFKTETCQYQVK